MKFITQIMTNKSTARSCEDVDEAVLNCAEVKALATGNPRLREKMELDNEITLLQLEQAGHRREKSKLAGMITELKKRIEQGKEDVENIRRDLSLYESTHDPKNYRMELNGRIYLDREEAARAMDTLWDAGMLERGVFGRFCGFEIAAVKGFGQVEVEMRGVYRNLLGYYQDGQGMVALVERAHLRLKGKLQTISESIPSMVKQIEEAELELKKPFEREEELRDKQLRQADLNACLELDKHSETVEVLSENPGKELGTEFSGER